MVTEEITENYQSSLTTKFSGPKNSVCKKYLLSFKVAMFLTCPLWTETQHISLTISNVLNRITQTALAQRSLT